MFDVTVEERILSAYLECALWSSTNDDAEFLDENYSVEDFAPETLAEIREELSDFLSQTEKILETELELRTLTPEGIGHDFWLTRNRHGAGFWDRGLGMAGKTLTAYAHTWGECNLFAGDDGLIYAN